MKLGRAPAMYMRDDQQETRRQIEMADDTNHKKNRDVEIGSARLILIAPNGSRWKVTVGNTGVLSAVAVT